VEEYLKVIKEEMELAWTYDNYIKYWKTVFHIISKKIENKK